MKFIALLNKQFELTLPVSIVFDYPTIQGIAHVITNSIKPNGVVHVSPAENRQKYGLFTQLAEHFGVIKKWLRN